MSDLSTFSPPIKTGTPKQISTSGARTIVVAGAGIFGSWTALRLLRAGYDVTLADPWTPGHSRASSGGESRLIRSFYGESNTYFEMASSSWNSWLQLEKEQNRRILYKTGVLWLFPVGYEDQIGNIVAKMEAGGLPFQNLDQRTLQKSFPRINSEDLQNGIVEQKAGFIHANIATNLVAAQFQKEGGKFVNERVLPDTKLPPSTQSGKQLIADLYVFASGPWLKNLFPFLPLMISRQEVTYFGVDNVAADGLIPWIDWQPSDFYYGIPDHGGRGFKLAHDVRGIEMDPTSDDRMPNPELISKSKKYLKHRFPFMKDAPVIESRVCQYSNSPDGHFIFDVHPEHDNVFILGGGSGHGFKHGPAIGTLVATSFEKGEIPFTFLLPDT